MVEVRGFGGRSGTAAQEQQPDLLAALQRQWTTILLAAFLGTVIAWAYVSARPTVYEARSTLLLIAAGDEVSPGGGRERTLDIETWATVARSTSVLQAVADGLGLDLADVRSRSTAVAAATGDVMYITFSASAADRAVEGATVYSDEFLANRQTAVNASTLERQRQLDELQEDLNTQIADLTRLIQAEEDKGSDASESQIGLLTTTQQRAIEKLADAREEAATLDANVSTGRVLVDPRTAVSRTGLSRSLSTLAGLMVGALLGVILALLRDRYDDRYGSASTPALLGIREIGRVPYRRAGAAARSVATHGYSRLLTRLTFARLNANDHARAVLLLPVDSRSLPDDIASSVAASLAASAETTGILIGVWADTDDVETRPGHWAEILEKVDALREQNDLVIVPVHSLDRSAAGIGLASLVDETVLLVSEASRMEAVMEALDDLEAVGARRVQVVVVTGIGRVRPSLPELEPVH